MNTPLLTTATIEELETELERRYAERTLKADEEAIARISTLNLRGFTVKDVVVRVERLYEGEGLRFSFALRRDGKDYDFYYDWQEWKEGSIGMVPLDWWPASKREGFWCNDALQFIPPGFTEESENCYSCDGTDAQALVILKAAGFVNVEGVTNE